MFKKMVIGLLCVVMTLSMGVGAAAAEDAYTQNDLATDNNVAYITTELPIEAMERLNIQIPQRAARSLALPAGAEEHSTIYIVEPDGITVETLYVTVDRPNARVRPVGVMASTFAQWYSSNASGPTLEWIVTSSFDFNHTANTVTVRNPRGQILRQSAGFSISGISTTPNSGSTSSRSATVRYSFTATSGLTGSRRSHHATLIVDTNARVTNSFA